MGVGRGPGNNRHKISCASSWGPNPHAPATFKAACVLVLPQAELVVVERMMRYCLVMREKKAQVQHQMFANLGIGERRVAVLLLCFCSSQHLSAGSRGRSPAQAAGSPLAQAPNSNDCSWQPFQLCRLDCIRRKGTSVGEVATLNVTRVYTTSPLHPAQDVSAAWPAPCRAGGAPLSPHPASRTAPHPPSPPPAAIFPLCAAARVEGQDILLHERQAGLLKPSFVLVRDHALRSVVLLIRGTHSFKDMFTSLTGAAGFGVGWVRGECCGGRSCWVARS